RGGGRCGGGCAVRMRRGLGRPRGGTDRLLGALRGLAAGVAGGLRSLARGARIGAGRRLLLPGRLDRRGAGELLPAAPPLLLPGLLPPPLELGRGAGVRGELGEEALASVGRQCGLRLGARRGVAGLGRGGGEGLGGRLLLLRRLVRAALERRGDELGGLEALERLVRAGADAVGEG